MKANGISDKLLEIMDAIGEAKISKK